MKNQFRRSAGVLAAVLFSSVVLPVAAAGSAEASSGGGPHGSGRSGSNSRPHMVRTRSSTLRLLANRFRSNANINDLRTRMEAGNTPGTLGDALAVAMDEGNSSLADRVIVGSFHSNGSTWTYEVNHYGDHIALMVDNPAPTPLGTLAGVPRYTVVGRWDGHGNLLTGRWAETSQDASMTDVLEDITDSAKTTNFQLRFKDLTPVGTDTSE